MRIDTADLLHKWGLQDGDILQPILERMGFDVMVVDEHEVLVALVRDLVLPQLEQKIAYKVLSTHHNPIRITHVDSVAINNYTTAHPHVRLTPETVDIPESLVRAYTERWLAEHDRSQP